MITTIKIVNTSITSHNCFFVCFFCENIYDLLSPTFKYFHMMGLKTQTNFFANPISNTVLLTIITMQYIRSPELIHKTGSMYSFTTSPHFSHFPAPGTQHSTLYFYEFNFFRFHICEIVWYLLFSVCLILLSIIPSRSIHLVINGRISFFFHD